VSTPNPYYRENLDRAVFATGPIDDSLVKEIIPKIIALRAMPKPEAITLYINSHGGAPVYGDAIYSALSSPTADGAAPWLITVATGYASSAAADLLIYGDYAISYPDCLIHCHGARYYTDEEEITVERARSTGESLLTMNESIALHLSKHMVHRLIFVFLSVKSEIDALSGPMDRVERFVWTVLSKAVLSVNARIVLRKTLERYKEINAVSTYVWSRTNIKKDDTLITIHAKLLRQIINFHLKGNKKGLKSLPIEKISEHFNLMKEYISGGYTNLLNPVTRRWGKFFLLDSEKEEHSKQAPENEFNWLVDKTQQRIRPLTYFAFYLCRILQEAENRLTATDAYWLGIVDEVMGSGLPSLRQLVESTPQGPS
jgi:ATP-dependent protease ClpP protease subunit